MSTRSSTVEARRGELLQLIEEGLPVAYERLRSHLAGPPGLEAAAQGFAGVEIPTSLTSFGQHIQLSQDSKVKVTPAILKRLRLTAEQAKHFACQNVAAATPKPLRIGVVADYNRDDMPNDLNLLAGGLAPAAATRRAASAKAEQLTLST